MANRRPIRRLPFPRRPFRRRKPAFGWTNGTFDQVPLDTLGGITRLDLIDHTDFEPSGASGLVLAGVAKIHRLQFKSFVQLLPETDADAFSSIEWLWALWQEDIDESDVELWGDPGNLIAQKRIIKWDMVSLTGFSTTGVNNEPFFSHNGQIPIKFDIRFRRPLTLMRDDRLVFALQARSDFSSLISNAVITAFVRISAQPPGTGR